MRCGCAGSETEFPGPTFDGVGEQSTENFGCCTRGCEAGQCGGGVTMSQQHRPPISYG